MKFYLPAIFLASVVLLPGCVSKAPIALNTPLSSPVSSTSTVEQTPTSVTSNWYTYTSQDNNYTALFPTKPEERIQSVKTATGNVNVKLAFYKDKQQNMTYLASDIKSDKKIPESEVSKALDEFRDGQLERGNKAVINEKKITMNGYSGKEFIAHSSEKNVYHRAKIFFDTKNSTFYQIIVVASQEADINSQSTTAFLDSLAIK
ncbi:hypothetical protein DSM106972_044540 [Dulcicalothrix desertica PCC 7102]|uniref:Lipoprotein n=1 Tax=Dulcicalothrix desertica PCC 7102 TaxID=232991 RepID=A0A3S1ALW2_9CYAN|nr:hypothetical protein [Dulcicalothrix desertica]RUT04226.1 hypothetical protein DSM106972_044540 [Dulcicalothrix desertica PCC 7102]TWH51470.1 hypothetical protein CAL7102_05890 [Dulcicalothrix desertica PCC 7102]